LNLMPAGRGVPNLSSLLEAPRGSVAFAEMLQRHDATVIDSPPLGAGADAASIGSRVDAVILVVDLQKATTKSLQRAMRRLELAHASVIGIAVNRDRAHGSVGYYGYFPEGNGSRRSRGPGMIERARRMLSV
jgi:Mrp family chromosome partitioning ATPase